MHHDEYVPLYVLSTTNQFAHEDYRALFEGRLEALNAVLGDGKRESRAWPETAQSWGSALGLILTFGQRRSPAAGARYHGIHPVVRPDHQFRGMLGRTEHLGLREVTAFLRQPRSLYRSNH